ncbi:AMP-binding protein [Marinobacter salinexigens]|uniref:AMP-binding protein n=1 Tax=Marinobacter salinexigens TaxID=2919747 RepID=A0A5B0VNA4_9GAMM|nr:AMP-binding protein [Marinobacter salinexigens]KAA1176106.1 AMP-binding protein [Marinobacter salinexigens]
MIHSCSTAPQLYLSALRQNPENIAIQTENRSVTCRQLETLGWQTVRVLQQQGLHTGDTIALLMSNRLESLVALLAVQLMGLRYVSLHPMASPEDHKFVLSDSQANALIIDDQNYSDRKLALADAVPTMIELEGTADRPGLMMLAPAMDDSPLTPPEDPGISYRLAYTGGTTGRSKGVIHTHRTLTTMVMQMLATYEWPDTPRYLVTTPISHAGGSLVIPTLLKGGTIYFMDKYSPELFLRMVEKYRINFTFLVPTQIYGLLDYPRLSEFDHSSLELVLYGASPIAPSRLQQVLHTFGQVFGQIYGQSEAPMTISYLAPKDHIADQPERLRSCGKIIIGNQVQLLSADGKPVPTGEIGELCVRSPLIMEKYLNRPEENEKVFAGGWLHTGDMARMDTNGYLYLVDRNKDMIISGGFNVYPSEVEHCLAQHPHVASSAVIGIPHEKWGEQVTAVVVPRRDVDCSAEDLISYVTKHKGAVNSPKQIIFVDELPLTAVGKIDKKALRAQSWAGEGRQIH